MSTLRRESGERMSEHIVEIVRALIGSAYDHGKWSGEEIARLQCERSRLEEDIDYLKGQVENLKIENAALRKKLEKYKEEA